MKIGDEVFVHCYVDEIRKDVVIVKNEGGYFGTVKEEIDCLIRCKDCKHYKGIAECELIGTCMGTNGYCAWGKRK